MLFHLVLVQGEPFFDWFWASRVFVWLLELWIWFFFSVIVYFFWVCISCTAKVYINGFCCEFIFCLFSFFFRRFELGFGRLSYLLLKNEIMILQGNPFWRLEIGNGSSSVPGIGSILMEQGQIGRPDRGIGKQQGRTALLCAILGMLEWRKP